MGSKTQPAIQALASPHAQDYQFHQQQNVAAQNNLINM